jgi:uncharacterized protein YndB with AHSA1/START domain
MFRIDCETFIRATPERVYQILTDLPKYDQWNPFNTRVDGGPAVEGGKLTVTVKMGKREMKVRHQILTMKPHHKFAWRDLGWFTLFAYGERARTIEPDGEGARYRVELVVTGPFAWLAKMQFGKHIEAGMKSETDALKRLAETRA